MKRKQTMKMFLLGVLMICGITLSTSKVYAEETQFTPATTMTAGPVLSMNNDGYFATTNGIAYASFVMPAQGGYLEIDYKNITIGGSAHAKVLSVSGEVLADAWEYSNGSTTFRFRSEPNGRNNAVLQPNTKYYIQMGSKNAAGNVKFILRFTEDKNPDGKEQAEEIQFNKEYTRSVDGYVGNDSDDDYFKFTATTSGACHFKIVNGTNGTIDYCVRKWGSDEYIKNSRNYDMKDYLYDNRTEEYDVILEKGQTYYLDVWGKTKGNYTFIFNNQSVQQIKMPSKSVTIADGKSYTLKPTVLPSAAYNKTLTYTSNNTDVAVVYNDTGEVRSVRPGKAVITATATDGSNTSASIVVYVTPAKPYKPSYRNGSSTYIELEWSSVYGADGYAVYRKSGNKWKKVKETTKTSCKIKKLSAGTKYQFKIKAYVKADGKKYSTYSDVAKLATAPKKTSITKIKRLSANTSSYVKKYNARIYWKKVKGATSYIVYYKKPGSSSKYTLGEYKGTSAKVIYTQYGYSSESKRYTFYVVPVKQYEGKTYCGPYSKGKTYTFK